MKRARCWGGDFGKYFSVQSTQRKTFKNFACEQNGTLLSNFCYAENEKVETRCLATRSQAAVLLQLDPCMVCGGLEFICGK